MNIEKRGNNWRITEMRDGIRYRVTVDHKPGKGEAEDLIRKKINETDPAGDIRDTFEESARKYILIRSNVISPSTIRGYDTIIRCLSDAFKRTKTAAITQELIQKEVNDYSAEHSPKSTRNLHGFISAVLGVYRPSLRLNTTLPKKEKFEPYTPSENEVKTLLNKTKGSEFEIAYRLGVYGLRRSEICAITSADLDGNNLHIDKGYVLNRQNEWILKPIPKTTDSIRTIYIDDQLAEMIRKMPGRAYNGNPNVLNAHLHRMQKKLELQPFRFHDLRAYYASMAHAMGIPDAYIMANGGWSSPHVMQRVYRRAMQDKANKINQMYAENFKDI